MQLSSVNTYLYERYILRDNETSTSTALFWIELVVADLDVAETQKQTRRLFKLVNLSAAEWYYNNDKHVLQTANKFKIDRKQVRIWVTG